MLNFNQFCDQVVFEIKDYLPRDFRDVKFCIREAYKNNGVKLYGLTLENCRGVFPIVYLGDYYQQYLNGKQMADIFAEISSIFYKNEVPKEFYKSAEELLAFDNVKNKIFPRLINAFSNEEFLQEHPHLKMEDLAVVYTVVFFWNKDTNFSVSITNEMLNDWDISDLELFEIAKTNALRDEPVCCTRLYDFIKEILLNEGLPEFLIKEFIGTEDEAALVFVVSNKKNFEGAASIIYSDILKVLSQKLGSDLYLIPSSINEFLVTPAKDFIKVDQLQDAIKNINLKEVTEHDRLSDHVYRYDANNHTLKLADTTIEQLREEHARKQELQESECLGNVRRGR